MSSLITIDWDYFMNYMNHWNGSYIENDNNINKMGDIKQEKGEKNYFPVFNCPHCNTNILKTGYKIYKEISFVLR